MEKTVKILGVVALSFGLAATVACFLPYGILMGIMMGFIGMLLSTIYIFLDLKYQVNSNKITVGLIAMLLSSIPVLVILGISIYAKMNS